MLVQRVINNSQRMASGCKRRRHRRQVAGPAHRGDHRDKRLIQLTKGAIACGQALREHVVKPSGCLP